MNNHDKQRIIDKIKRCLALSKSSNEHEAATALRQAHKMMTTHKIDLTDIDLSDIKFNPSSTRMAARPATYQIGLASMIAKLFGCEPYVGYGTGSLEFKRVMCFAGIEMHATIASYAFDSLSRQLKKARLEYIKTALKRVRLTKNKTARADAFCLGWVVTVEGLVSKLVPLSANMTLIEKAMSSELNLKSKPLTGIDRVSKNKATATTNDFWRGTIAGKDAQLHHAMHGEDGKTLIS